MAQQLDGTWIVSPQDVVSEFECSHKVALTAAVASQALTIAAVPDEGLMLLQDQGLRHEQERLDGLDPSWRVKRLGSSSHSIPAYQAAWDATRAAMEQEYDAIYQATLFTGDFIGIADFLVLARDDAGNVVRADDGRAVYEPVDTKSARSAKRGAVLQVGAYAEALVRLGCPTPSKVHLWLAGDDDWSGAADPVMALAREIRERVTVRLPQLGSAPQPDWAPPREACARCCFTKFCDEGRHRDRDLSMVQAIRSTTRQRLVDSGLPTIDLLATAGDDDRPPRVSRETFDRLRAQAAIQLQGERQGRIIHEVVDAAELQKLPPRSPGDLWFDMEGDPYAPGRHGLEYMFGFGFLRDGTFDFDTTEAHDAASERRAFEDFVDLVMRRYADDPGMHVYHYADYERRTLQRLAQQHGTREAEVDLILQRGILIDLYSVVRAALRFSTESLSLKYIEAAYGVSHSGEDVSTAMDSVIQYEHVATLRAQGKDDEADEVLARIRSYNRLDCKSTMQLDDWLRTLVPPRIASPIGAWTLADNDEADDEAGRAADPHADLVAELEQSLPADVAARSPEEHARALLSAALQFHPRERRPAWWKLFELIKAEPEDLERASDVLVVDDATATEWAEGRRGSKARRTVTVTSHGDDPRMILEAAGQAFLLYADAAEGMPHPADSTRGYKQVVIETVGDDAVYIRETSGLNGLTWSDLPIAVLPGPPYNTDPIRRAIAEAAQSVTPSTNGGCWAFPDAAWADLLLARAPRSSLGVPPRTGDAIADICASLQESDASYVAVQGPPGTGKTYVGSRAVAHLAAQGWRIGIVAQSHAVVDNFLHAVAAADSSLQLGKETQSGKPATHPWHLTGKAKVETWAIGQAGGYVMGGTAWTFSRPAVRDLHLDLLVIDEAGQFALANAIACSQAARTVLLLGDPQQLPQVTQASHPEAIEASVLEHVIQGHPTMPADRGYFLDETFRMHPDLTRVVSRLAYEGKLGSAPVTAMRHLEGVTPGVIPVEVDHEGNTTSSPEEAERVVSLVRELLGRTWTGARDDRTLDPRAVTEDDLIVVAAYNAQVRLLRGMVADAGFSRIQVGTVDKFQGREEVVVVVSMATSSDDDLPRGIEFLLSPNRLNVAISRAQWACYLVHSPRLLDSRPASIQGLQRLGSFLQLARPVDQP
jgi:uncharacterized protein